MLRLDGITKNYFTATETVAALRGVSLAFRKNEFVSILGPSGCGKTTLLNIIGGLDRYTDGNLFIGGRPTAEFGDREWDVYRNHRVGFIFQSYNLIPHQTILQNVELALTIAGIGREERVRRAKETLDRVGLAGMYHKRPNQLSGGQCQRVAIARALVNDPEILLADEPTGALDTVTSGQIMDLIREIAGERLVIMVTHNPELAEQYSTRIVRLLDGLVIEDTNPFAAEDEIAECEATAAAERAADELAEQELIAAGATEREVKRAARRRREKAKMSFFTAFRLSARNLLSKRRRTALVGFAGSIGIIGIAMVLAISAGISGYIVSMQDDMLSGNPITITQSAYDYEALLGMMSVDETLKIPVREGFVNANSMIEYLATTQTNLESMMITNDLTDEYVKYVLSMPEDFRAAIRVDWGMNLSHSIYTERTLLDGTVAHPSITALTASYAAQIGATETFTDMHAIYATSLGNLMAEMPDNADYILSQYDLLSGRMPNGKNEVILVVSADTELTDITLAKLGYYTEEQFLNLVYHATDSEYYDESKSKPDFSYEELLAKKLTFYPNDAIYTYKDSAIPGMPGTYTYAGDTADISSTMRGEGVDISIVGILRPKEEISFGCLQSGLYYTKALTDYVLAVNESSAVLDLFGDADSLTSGIVNGMTLPGGISYTCTYFDPTVDPTANPSDRKETTDFVGSVGMEALMAMMMNPNGDPAKKTYTVTLSRADIGAAKKPEGLTIYPTNFENKDLVTEWLDLWNAPNVSGDEVTLSDGRTVTLQNAIPENRSDVTYTDTLSIIIDMINSMIKVVSTALICFTSVSLIVSTVMIGILTHVSVVERTKEIGVIRSLGGRKKDVRALFNAETFIIGFLAGLLGVVVTSLLSLALNLAIKIFADITVTAYLPFYQAVIMIALSVGLTLISGLIPASAAARRDPVNALRSE